MTFSPEALALIERLGTRVFEYLGTNRDSVVEEAIRKMFGDEILSEIAMRWAEEKAKDKFR